MKKTVGTLLGALLCTGILGFGGGQIAQARMLGNPVTDTVKGGMDAGIGLSSVSKDYEVKVPVPRVCLPPPFSTTCTGGGTAKGSETDSVGYTTIFLDYGISEKGVLRGEVSQVSFGVGSASGTEFGVNYRQNFSTRTLASGKVMKLGGLVGYETGSFSGDNFGVTLSGSYTEYQAAFGGSIALEKNLNVYAAGIFDNYAGSISGSGFKITSSSKNPLGAYGGADFSFSSDFRIGGEYHLIFEQGWAVYGLLKF